MFRRGHTERQADNDLVSVPVGIPDVQPDTRSLDELEGTIRQGLKTFMEVGKALASIRERRLYKDRGYTTFEEYCREEWGWSRVQAHRQIQAAKITETLPIGNRPQRESLVRPLARIEDPEERAQVWQEACEEAKADNTPVTAKHIEQKVQERKPLTEDHAEQESQEPTVADLPQSALEDLPPFDLSKERKVYYQLSGYLVGLKDLDPAEVASECESSDAAERDIRHAEGIIRWFEKYKDALGKRTAQTSELRRIK